MSHPYRFDAIDHHLWCFVYQEASHGLGTRMTVIRMQSGGLFVHSPGPLDAKVKDDLAGLGPVQAIVAPNDFHHLFLAEFADAYPEARVFATPGVAKKQPKVRIDEILGEKPSDLWSADLEQIALAGMGRMNEVVFFHPASGSLIVTDLLFNVPNDVPFLARMLTRAAGTYGRFAVSRLLKRFMVTDRDVFLASVARLYDWPFTRVLLAHREIYDGGPEAVTRAFERF